MNVPEALLHEDGVDFVLLGNVAWNVMCSSPQLVLDFLKRNPCVAQKLRLTETPLPGTSTICIHVDDIVLLTEAWREYQTKCKSTT